jgi:hypothetical protein
MKTEKRKQILITPTRKHVQTWLEYHTYKELLDELSRNGEFIQDFLREAVVEKLKERRLIRQKYKVVSLQ